jgi:predicted dehydrogenase
MQKKLGIIGCGAVTQSNYVKVLKLYHDIDVKYVHDLNENLANDVASQLGAEAVTKDYLLANSDIVIIATPPSSHYPLIKDSLKKGIKIICEKPFVGKVSECQDLVKLVSDVDAELFVAHFRRLYPSVVLARSIVKSGVLGDIKSIEVYEGGKFSWTTQSGYVYKDPYGGVLFDTGSHTIDMALYIACLDQIELTPKILNIKKDKEEPAHDVEANLALETQFSKIDLKVKLSRRLLLSNKVRITGENGFIDVPAVMTNHLRMGTEKSSTVVYSDINYDELMDCFAMQFKEMFYDKEDSIFEASRFTNLTKVLELIAQN